MSDFLLDFARRLPPKFGESKLYALPVLEGARLLVPLNDRVPGNLTNTRIVGRAFDNSKIRRKNDLIRSTAGVPPMILYLHLSTPDLDYGVTLLKESSGKWWVIAKLPFNMTWEYWRSTVLSSMVSHLSVRK